MDVHWVLALTGAWHVLLEGRPISDQRLDGQSANGFGRLHVLNVLRLRTPHSRRLRRRRHNQGVDLYLVRHGIAYDPDPAQWPDDKDRPLTPEGEKRFRQVARGLRELVPSVSVVLSSPWARAWRTAELLEKEAHWPAPVASEALESGRSPAEVLQALQPFDGSAGVVLVGHEPNMHELASYLLTADTGHAQLEFRKGGTAYLELGEGSPRPGAARLVWLLTPKALRLMGR